MMVGVVGDFCEGHTIKCDAFAASSAKVLKEAGDD